MKRIRILALVLCASFVSAVWAQPRTAGPRTGKFARHHRPRNALSKANAQPDNSRFGAEAAIFARV